ncbi:MAG TPA: glycine betaine ABC transporter substrate-binding protein, partial [Myxococcales bacterium]|nr:glycine betaine ABC transporter substrate-binding protein [Myxococcales bacterium]
MILALLAVVQVGSKVFTESVIVAEMAAQLAHSAGVTAVHRRELGGSRILWDALLAGQLDVYPEYTGTLTQELLPGSASGLRQRVEERGVAISRSLGFSDSYAIGMKRTKAARLGIRTIDDLARHPELKIGFSNEFMDRKDGWPALRRAYGLPQRFVRGLDHDLAYR